ncbi:hypothetical protein S0112_024 [Shewanella phage S0112]|nr:hypothetical protein S0112_024 [Shewanella phage S0112]
MAKPLQNFLLEISWSCPVCGSIQGDSDPTIDGPIDEFWCSECETTFNLSSQTQSGPNKVESPC